ncbi:unnamed protein product [Paramecium pentaurelia]|uniref:Uncharacterized protein n=1 Tax=Paramecium pentaurelia TaxID=43138 RepID=A0A8S1X4Y9_9CILI|nr:unnamed protein product [Paramecium pentaurelia]
MDKLIQQNESKDNKNGQQNNKNDQRNQNNDQPQPQQPLKPIKPERMILRMQTGKDGMNFESMAEESEQKNNISKILKEVLSQ